ncbi:CPBP family intramembrane metalloprotease, partial [Clostridioides difficile]|nr:CPBP family intramembrane metalloprotease [Clostridioides difficile]
SIIMTTFYNLNKTLIIPIVIHQLFNFLIGIINGDLIELINYYAMLYLIFAIALIVINPGNVLYKNIRE